MVNRGRPKPREAYVETLVDASQTGARPTACCNKILTSLSETVTSQACVDRGGEREERNGLGEGLTGPGG